VTETTIKHRELWTGEAVDQLLVGLGIELGSFRYRVIRDEWDLSSPDVEVRTVVQIEVTT
jgi:hypothetical protein